MLEIMQVANLDRVQIKIRRIAIDIASLVRSFNLNENQIRFLSKGYQPNDEIFNFDVLQKWITFIDFLDQIWEIALTKLSKNL